MRQLARFIMRGRLQAVGIAGFFGVLSLFVIPMAYLSGAAVGLVGLRKGDMEALIVCAGAGVIILLIAHFAPARPGLNFPVVFAIWAPVLLCSSLLRRIHSQAIVVSIASLFAALFVIGMHVVTGDVVAWWTEWLRAAASDIDGASVEGFEKDNTLRLMNGLVAVVYGLSVTLTMLLARWWQAILYNPGGFRAEFHALRLPRVMLPAIVSILLLAGMISQGVLSDLFMVCVLMYFFQGLAVMHALVATKRWGWGGLAPLYVALFLVPQYVLMGLGLVGAMDQFVDFRTRASQTGK